MNVLLQIIALQVHLQVHGGRKDLRIMDAMKYMLREGGVKGLWRGNGVNVIKIAPESALKFGCYEKVKQLIKGDSARELSIYERFCAGSTAGAFSQTVIYPLEVMKTRLALRKTGEITGIFDCAKKIYKAEGVKVFYKGYWPNLFGIIPYAGIDLAIYETLKNNNQISACLKVQRRYCIGIKRQIHYHSTRTKCHLNHKWSYSRRRRKIHGQSYQPIR